MYTRFSGTGKPCKHEGNGGHTKKKLTQPTYWTVDTGVNYLLTINHHYYYPMVVAVAPAVEQVSGMVIIILLASVAIFRKLKLPTDENIATASSPKFKLYLHNIIPACRLQTNRNPSTRPIFFQSHNTKQTTTVNKPPQFLIYICAQN